MRSNPIYILVIFIFSCTTFLGAQDYTVIQASGEAYAVTSEEDKERFTKIVLGPLPEFEYLIIKDEASITIINEDNNEFRLNEEQKVFPKDMDFTPASDHSMFYKFCKYFKSFFADHSSKESKASYKNSIYAISRGMESKPTLDFPLDGSLPYVEGEIPFYWTHKCNDCEYVVNIYDYETRVAVYAWTTIEKSVTLEEANKYLLPGKKYYWNVTISGQEMEYDNSIFTVADEKDYSDKLRSMNESLDALNYASNEAKLIFILQELSDQNLDNYAILYGLQKAKKNKENEMINNYVERFWYDLLSER